MLLLILFLLFTSLSEVHAQVVSVPSRNVELLQFGCNDIATAADQYMIQRSSVANCPTAENMQNETQKLNYFRLTALSMKCTVQTTPTAGSTWVYTFRVAGVASALTCTIANPATSCGPVYSTVVANADTGVSVLWAETGAGIDGSPAQCNVLVELQP